MDRQYTEITEIPQKVFDFWNNGPAFSLPLRVPYLGMGSSYFAPLAFKFMGQPIYPELASEFVNYPESGDRHTNAVILSQSGRSTEALWSTLLVEKFTAIVNDIDGPLCKYANVAQVVSLMAGEEQYSSSKTYINTLLALFKGLGFSVERSIELLMRKFKTYESKGQELSNQVIEILNKETIHGIYIIGSGPNIATALQAALILSESTKLCFTGLAMAQYDHGPKETAKNSIVIQILAKGKSYDRGIKLAEKIALAGSHVFTVEEPESPEEYSVLHNIIPFNFMTYYLSKHLNIVETFTVGGKVTEVI